MTANIQKVETVTVGNRLRALSWPKIEQPNPPFTARGQGNQLSHKKASAIGLSSSSPFYPIYFGKNGATHISYVYSISIFRAQQKIDGRGTKGPRSLGPPQNYDLFCGILGTKQDPQKISLFTLGNPKSKSVLWPLKIYSNATTLLKYTCTVLTQQFSVAQSKVPTFFVSW